jgi:G3E family GTPase
VNETWVAFNVLFRLPASRPMFSDPSKRLPVTVITGYLGAGKTTLLNRLLTQQSGKKVAIIVNEFGELGIDSKLVVHADEQIVAMNNGCICCTVRGDLIRIIGELMERRDQFDHLVIETTGLADPGPVIQSFFVDEVVRRQTALDAVVTVVDAKHIWEHLNASEAQEQIAFADVLVINKKDLVSDQQLQNLEARIRRINAFAKIYHTENCDLSIEAVLGINAFDLKNALSIDPQLLEDSSHAHDQSVSSVSIVNSGNVSSKKLTHWLNRLVEVKGRDIFRIKGILNVDQEDRRFVFQGVHMLLEGRPGRPWRTGESRQSEIVFIGRNLDRNSLKEQFQACQV